MNTRRVISECISRGNAEYAFYNAYLDNENMSPILSKLAQYVQPISITSPNSHVKSLLRSSCIDLYNDLRNSYTRESSFD